MAVSYNFKNKAGELVSLNDIDTRVCEYWDIEVDTEEYSMPYQLLTMAIVGIGLRHNEVTQEAVDQMIEKDDTLGKSDDKWSEFYRKFMYKDFLVEVWR